MMFSNDEPSVTQLCEAVVSVSRGEGDYLGVRTRSWEFHQGCVLEETPYYLQRRQRSYRPGTTGEEERQRPRQAKGRERLS